MVHEVARSVAQPERIVVRVGTPGAAASPDRSMALAIGVTVAVIVIGVAFTVFRARHVGRAIDANAARISQMTRPLALRELPTLTERGYRTVDAPAPPGGWRAFDPVANAPWAAGIAKAWAADAQLTRIDLAVIGNDGTTDLTKDRQDDIGYRFTSPARVAEWEKIADREADASVPYELMMRIAGPRVLVYVHSGRPPREPMPPPMDSLPMRDLLARARQSPRFPDHPFYSGFLFHTDRAGWIWYLQSLSRRDSIPQVRARDGAVYPWR